MIEIRGSYWMRVKFETREVGEPGQRRGITWHDFLRSPARRKMQLNYFNPVGATFRCALLVEVLARDSIRITYEHVGTVTGASQRSLRHGNVVTGEVQLRVLWCWKQNLVRVGDR